MMVKQGETMSAMPQLNDAEAKYFESGGEDVAASLREETPELDTQGAELATGDDAGVEMAGSIPETKPEKESREGRFVPLQALQEERAEKKQLREELRQYREWQAQLAQRLQQMPQGQQAQIPDPQTKPLDYINHVLGSMQNSTAELQQWRQQQEMASQQRATVQQYADWARGQESEFSKGQPEYRDAYRFAAESRDKELQTLGYSDPAARANIVRMNTAEIINNAVQQGRNPAELVWEYARARGFAPKGARNADGQAKITAGLQAVGGKLNRGGETGEGELSAKDLSGITDPDEFEKAWKRVFGRKR
jgi:hypothetical protein